MESVSIPLYGARGATRGVLIAHAIVDAADAAVIGQYQWRVWHMKCGLDYAYRSLGDGRRRPMHRELLGNDSAEIDHANRNGLDNRRENLRPCSHAENMQNCKKPRHGVTSTERGVSWFKRRSVWRAEVQLNGRKVFSKYFPCHDDAVTAVRQARREFLPFSTF